MHARIVLLSLALPPRACPSCLALDCERLARVDVLRGFEGHSCSCFAQDISGARVVTTGYVNETPQTCIELVEGTRNHRFGEALSPVEQKWLAVRINEHIKVRMCTQLCVAL